MWTPWDDERSLIVLLVAVIQWSAGHATDQRAEEVLRYRTNDDLVFTGADFLWGTTRLSVVSCAAACMDDPLCVSFTAHRTDQGKVQCRGHSSQSPQSGGTPHPGARRYQLQSRPESSPTSTPSIPTTTSTPTGTTTTTSLLTTSPKVTTVSTPVTTTTAQPTAAAAQWLNSSCASDSDCGKSNADCFQGQCLCTPGHYYSLSTASCLDACASADLQDQFIAYQGYRFGGSNLAGYPQEPLSQDECQKHCASSSAIGVCRTAKYRISRNRCGITGVSRFDLQSSDWTTDSNFIYFQRMCL